MATVSTDASKQELAASHKARIDTFAPKRILMVVANPATSTTLGWPVGVLGRRTRASVLLFFGSRF